MKNNARGFTLLEMLVVLVVMGTLSAFSLPNLLSRVDSTTEENKISLTKRFFNEVIITAKRSNKNLFVTASESELYVWNIDGGKQVAEFSRPKYLNLTINTNKEDLKATKEQLNIGFDFVWVAFASGEYAPLTAKLKTEESFINLVGDGVNTIETE